jgi:hypothetical protein
MTDVLDIGYPLVVLVIAVGLGVLGYFAWHISERMIRKSIRARGTLSDAEPRLPTGRCARRSRRCGPRTAVESGQCAVGDWRQRRRDGDQARK